MEGRPRLSLHSPGPQTHFLSQAPKGDLKCQLLWVGPWPGRPGLATHYHGREGSFSPPSLLLPPSPSSLPAPLVWGQTELRLIPAHTSRPHSCSRSPDTSSRREGSGAACSHVSPQPGHSGPAHSGAICQLSTRLAQDWACKVAGWYGWPGWVLATQVWMGWGWGGLTTFDTCSLEERTGTGLVDEPPKAETSESGFCL